MIAAYLKSLPDHMRQKLAPVKRAEALPRLTLDTDASKPNDLAFQHKGQTLRVALKRLWTAPSMQSYDKIHEGAACMDWSGPKAMCSSCRRVTRWVDGEKRQTWACSGIGRFPKGYVEGSRKCDCRAGADMNVLAAKWSKSGTYRQGSKVLVEPFKLAQHSMTGGTTKIELGSSFGEDGVTNTSIEAVVLEKSILALGAAVHARYANGTYLPLVAAIPR